MDEKYDSFLEPNVWYKNENNNADDVSHINIHLPISTNKNKGMNATNWEQTIVLFNFWLRSFFLPIKSLIDINMVNNHMPGCQKINKLNWDIRLLVNTCEVPQPIAAIAPEGSFSYSLETDGIISELSIQ